MGDTADYSPSSLHTWNKDDCGFHLPYESAPPAPEPYHNPGKDQWKAAYLTNWIQADGVIRAAPATLNPAPHTCTSRRIGLVRHVRDGREGRAGGGDGAQIGEEEGAGVGAPGRMHIHSARGISDNGALVGDDG
jgi:hypothetical protein